MLLSAKEIEYVQAPCSIGLADNTWYISAEGQEETKEGACHCRHCPNGKDGCCVDSIGQIIPKIIKGGN